VPKLKRMTLSRARRALNRAHCALGRVKTRVHYARRPLIVVSQAARPASTHPAGHHVSLVLR
jgi:hypothetical protein